MKIKISQKSIALAPKNIDLEHSAAIPQAANTSLLALRNIASLRKGHKLLINGASGGVGTIALQIASIYEAETTAVTSYRNIDWIKEEFKSQNIIDYTKEDFTNLNEKYDVIFDANGNKSFPDVEKCLNSNGVYVTTKNNIYNQIDFIKQFVKNKKSRVVLSAKSTTSSLDMFRMWVEDGKLKPIIEEWHKKFNVTEHVKMKSSLKFCVIAAGEYDLYVAEPRACEWDIAALLTKISILVCSFIIVLISL